MRLTPVISTRSSIRTSIPGLGEQDAFASAVDTERFGEYRITQRPDDPRPLYRFEGRISNDGSTPYAAEAGRYHIYSGWFCPWAQRVTIAHALAGLEDVISVSYVDGARDAVGGHSVPPTALTPSTGSRSCGMRTRRPNPDSTGTCRSPTLWDRVTGRVVSNQFRTIGIDLATQFGALATAVIDTYPADLADEIEQLDEWIGPNVNRGVNAVGGEGAAAADARAALARHVPPTRRTAEHPPLPARRPPDRGRHPPVRHARALRPDRQRGSHHQPWPCGVPAAVGLRPRPLLDPRLP